MKIQTYLPFLALLILPLHAERTEPGENAPQIMSLLSRTLPQVHMSHEPISEGVGRRTLENFLRALDFDRSIFLAEDVAHLRAQAANLDTDMKEGHVDFAFEAFDLYKQRALDRATYVETLLEEGFDLDVEENYIWRRKDAAWAEDEAAWNELWRKKVKNEYLGILIGRHMGELDAEEARLEADAETPEDSEEDPEVAEEEQTEAVMKADLSPEERIRKRYTQFVEVVEGHDAEYVLQMFLSSFTGAYDVHSSYLSPRREEDFDIQMKL